MLEQRLLPTITIVAEKVRELLQASSSRLVPSTREARQLARRRSRERMAQ